MAFHYSTIKNEKFGDVMMILPGADLVKERIKDKLNKIEKDNSLSNLDSEPYDDYSNGIESYAIKELVLRKSDKKIILAFENILKDYSFKDAKVILDSIENNLKNNIDSDDSDYNEGEEEEGDEEEEEFQEIKEKN